MVRDVGFPSEHWREGKQDAESVLPGCRQRRHILDARPSANFGVASSLRERNEVTLMSSQKIYWHRDLPPPSAEIVGEHTVEATSGRVPGTLEHRSELWDRCHLELMTQTRTRLEQEMARMEGNYAHVFAESIDPRHDDVTGEAWLHGRFTYMLYRE